MKAFRQYWSFSAIRGAMTILAAIAIIGIPHFAAAILPIPVAMGFALDCFATYCMLDAGAMLLLGLSLRRGSQARTVSFVRCGGSITIAFAFYAVIQSATGPGRIAPCYLLALIAGQATLTALAELLIARTTHRQYGCASCYATAAVPAAFAVGLALAGALDTFGQLVALSAYVGVYGLTQVALAGRMLFLEYRSEHPLPALAEPWREEMFKPLPVDSFASAGEQTARAIRHGYLMPGQARILTGHGSPHHRAA